MSMLFTRYVIGFLIGVLLGVFFPALASWWSLFFLLGIFVINEFFGRLGFGKHWRGYRFSSYMLFAFVVVFVFIGIFFGSGKLGELLIIIGTFIS